MARLARRFYGVKGAAWAVFLLALEPCVLVIGSWGFPDAPLLFFWALTVTLVWRALEENRPACWLAAGAALGAGMLSKYTAVFLVPSVLGYLLCSQTHRRWLVSPWPYLAGIVSLVVLFPVLSWNWMHDWVSFHFQGTARFQALTDFSLPATRNFVGEQWLCVLPFTLPLGLVAFWHGVRSAQPEERYLFWMFLPTFAFIGLFGLTPNYHVLWPLPAYLGLTLLMAGLMARGGNRIARFYQAWARWLAGAGVAALILTLVLVGYGTPGIPHRQDLYGWDEVATRVQEERQDLSAGSFYLAIGSHSYSFPSQLAFHLAAPEEVRAATLIGVEVLNYRFWDHPEQLVGKDAVLVMEDGQENSRRLRILAKYFRSLEAAGEMNVPVTGIPLVPESCMRFLFYRAYGYRGPQPIVAASDGDQRKDTDAIPETDTEDR
jgi:hypothetical protein